MPWPWMDEPPLGKYIAGWRYPVAPAMPPFERRSSDAFMAELDRVQRLETELANIRAADVAAWRAKHGGPKVEPIVPSPGG